MTPPLILIRAASAVVGNRLAKAGAWVLIALIAGALLWLGKCTYDRGVIGKYTSKVEAADARADAAGTTKAAETKGHIDAGNQRAQAAADRSDDPLAAAYDQLRAEATGGDKAAR